MSAAVIYEGWANICCCLSHLTAPTLTFLGRQGHVDANGRDLDWEAEGWMASRCPGVCDVTTSACYCDGKFGHVPPPLGSAPGTPPIKQGRMLGDHCFPKKVSAGCNPARHAPLLNLDFTK